MAADLFAGQPVSLQDMLGCARRELAMRERAYPGWVARKRMTQEKADQELRYMRAIVTHFEQAVPVAALAAQQRRKTLSIRA